MSIRRLTTRNGSLCRLLLIVVAGALFGTAASPLVPGSTAANVRKTSSDVHVWLTTADGTDKLTPMGNVQFTRAQPTVPTVVVDPSRSFQSMVGFGGSITDSSAVVLYRLSPSARATAMRMLFDPRTGDGLSYLRQPIGASDFVAKAPYTYDDLPAGATDYPQRHFSIAHDKAQILPLLRWAKRLNPRLRIVATPWSPPAWMKTGGSLIGGRLIDDPKIYRSYALYLTKFVEAYRAQGVTVNQITVQNEPQNHAPAGYPGTDMSAAQEEKVIEDLGPMPRSRSEDTDPRLRPQLVRASERHRHDPARRDPGHQRLSARGPLIAGGSLGRRHGVSLLLRRPERDDRAAQPVPGQGHLLHRVLRQPVERPGEYVLRHAQVAFPQPDHRLAAKLGQDRRQLERRAGSVGRPMSAAAATAPASSRSAPVTGSPPMPSTTRSDTSAASSRRAPSGSPARRSGRPAERPGDGRCLPQSRRHDGAGRAQRERQPAGVRRA